MAAPSLLLWVLQFFQIRSVANNRWFITSYITTMTDGSEVTTVTQVMHHNNHWRQWCHMSPQSLASTQQLLMEWSHHSHSSHASQQSLTVVTSYVTSHSLHTSPQYITGTSWSNLMKWSQFAGHEMYSLLIVCLYVEENEWYKHCFLN